MCCHTAKVMSASTIRNAEVAGKVVVKVIRIEEVEEVEEIVEMANKLLPLASIVVRKLTNTLPSAIHKPTLQLVFMTALVS